MRAFFAEGQSDLAGFTAAITDWVAALDDEAGGDSRPLALTLAGVSDHLVAKGLTYDSDASRAEAGGLFALAAGAALTASAERAAALGPYPEFDAERSVAIGSIEDAVGGRAAVPPKSELATIAAKALDGALKAVREDPVCATAN